MTPPQNLGAGLLSFVKFGIVPLCRSRHKGTVLHATCDSSRAVYFNEGVFATKTCICNFSIRLKADPLSTSDPLQNCRSLHRRFLRFATVKRPLFKVAPLAISVPC